MIDKERLFSKTASNCMKINSFFTHSYHSTKVCFIMSHRKHEMLVNENIYSRPDLEYNEAYMGTIIICLIWDLMKHSFHILYFQTLCFKKVCFKISHMKCWLTTTYILDRISDVGLGFMATIMIFIAFNLRLNEHSFHVSCRFHSLI